MKLSGNTILVTGGGSGIGMALAQRLHDAGNTVIVAGRRQAALDQACAGRADMHGRTLDIDDGRAIDAFAAQLTADFPALNILINNAGIMRIEPIDRRRAMADAEATIATNLLGPIRMTNALVDHLKEQADAVVMNVTSGLAFVPLIDAAVYSATKAAIHSYSIALRAALAGQVEVIEIAPPAVQTDLTPGQAQRSGYMPLADYADGVMAALGAVPTPAEVLVGRAQMLRDADRLGQFDAALEQINAFARAARAG